MVYDPRQFVVRRPRHTAVDDSESRIWLETVADTPEVRHDLQLVDFSRKGAKLTLNLPVAPDSDVILHIEATSQGVDLQLPGKVRWQRIEGPGSWVLGCMFEQEVPYEVIGEMFLSGVLSTDSNSDHA